MPEKSLTIPDKMSPERQRLLDCLAEKPFNSITELCETAGVSRETYYQAIRDKAFVTQLFQNTKQSFYVALPQIMNKIAAQAKGGSPFHQQFLLKILEVYEDKPNVQVNVQNNTLVMPTLEQVKEDWLAIGRAHPEWKEEL